MALLHALSIRLDRDSATPLFRQLYDAIKAAILAGSVTPGMQLPPSRSLAEELGVSRQTVVNAYAQLSAEGYFSGTVGRGSFVSDTLPVRGAVPAGPRGQPRSPADGIRPLSARGQRIVDPRFRLGEQIGPPRAFRAGMPALEAFPFELWARLEGRRWRRPPPSLGYADPSGYAPLRELLAVHLRVTRGVRCEPGQIIVTTGAQQAMQLAAQLLLSPGDHAWIENPCYRGALAAFQAAGVQPCPVAVDSEGLRVSDGAADFPKAKLVYVTPSHQYPLGVTMSLERRLALLDWAERHQAWILEDDYDSEYRYSGPAPASLHSLDRAGSVLYIGTLSKSFFPALRLGYLVVPPLLVDAFRSGKATLDRLTPLMPQAVLADFIAEGHFRRQIKRTRELYDERRQILLEELGRRLGGLLQPGPSDAGLQLAAAFPRPLDDQAVVAEAGRRGIELRALSSFHLDSPLPGRGAPAPSGLLLGFACVAPEQIRTGVAALARLLAGDGSRTAFPTMGP